MKPRLEFAARALDLGLLRGASLLVPGWQRAEWRQEWHAELWAGAPERALTRKLSWAAEREMARFCLGACQDASMAGSPAKKKTTGRVSPGHVFGIGLAVPSRCCCPVGRKLCGRIAVAGRARRAEFFAVPSAPRAWC